MTSRWLFAVSCALGSQAWSPQGTYQSHEVTPWPKPTHVTNGSSMIEWSPGGVVASTASGSALLRGAVERLNELLSSGSGLAVSPRSLPPRWPQVRLNVTVSVASDAEDLAYGIDESYSLSLGADGLGHITAASVFGAMHGLTTLAQLVERGDSSGATVRVRGLPWTINDEPRFAHRGMLVDTSRHFLPLDVLKGHIDAMAMNKLNVLHLHLVDFQSFPFDVPSLPNLVSGAYSEDEVYTAEDLSSLRDYAQARGVRIMVEIDTPGHSASWGRGMSEVVVSDCPETLRKRGDGFATLDPTNEATYKAVRLVLQDVGKIFTDSFFHLGGDEVRFQCWQESKSIASYMEAKGYGSDYSLLEAEYLNRLLDIAQEVLPERTLAVYQEVFDNGIKLPAKVAFAVWKAGNIQSEVQALAKAGHSVIVANGNGREWYLNCGFGNGDHVSLWPSVYSLDPLNGTDLTAEEAKLVIGGEASLWGEEIDASNLAEKAWPRGAAFAERMWSAREVNDVNEAGPRLARQFCRMQSAGVRASPIMPGSCLRQESVSALHLEV